MKVLVTPSSSNTPQKGGVGWNSHLGAEAHNNLEQVYDLQMEITEMVPMARMQIPHSARSGKGETPAQRAAGAGEVKGGGIVGCCMELNKYYKKHPKFREKC